MSNATLTKPLSEMMPEASEVPGFPPRSRAAQAGREAAFKQQSRQVKGSLLMDSMTQVTEDTIFRRSANPISTYDAVELPDDGPDDVRVQPRSPARLRHAQSGKGLKLEATHLNIGDEEINQAPRGRFCASRCGARTGRRTGVGRRLRHVNLDVLKDGKSRLEDFRTSFPFELPPEVLSFDGNLEKFDELLKGAKRATRKTAKVTVSEDARNESLQRRWSRNRIVRSQADELAGTDDEFVDRKIRRFRERRPSCAKASKQSSNRAVRFPTTNNGQRIREQITELLTESADWELPPELLKRQASGNSSDR